LHCAGIAHGDFEPRNVVQSSRKWLRIIDYSHAYLHRCHPHRCEELTRAATELQCAGFFKLLLSTHEYLTTLMQLYNQRSLKSVVSLMVNNVVGKIKV
jgi:hypothetical protein